MRIKDVWALAVIACVSFAPLPLYAQTKPSNIADLVAQISDAVVNISATQILGDKNQETLQDFPKGTPFDDMFEQFFKNHGINGIPRPRHASSLGSGFVVDPTGVVITNNHVVGDATDIVVIFTDGRKLKAKVIGKDPKTDIAVLKVSSNKPFKSVKFGDSDKIRVGDGVIAVGNPFGIGESVTAGILSARNRNIAAGPYDDFLQTDAAINKGNSGGPLFNMQGEVIGINTAIISPTGGSVGIGFATPSDSVLPTIAQLQKFGETRRGWLGVRIQEVDDAIAENLHLPDTQGALVASVDPKGPSQPAGIQSGDVIIKFDGKTIKQSRDLPRLVASSTIGAKVNVTILRKGKELTLEVKLGRLEDGERQAGKDDAVNTDAESAVVLKSLGIKLSALHEDQRQALHVKDGLKGVLITEVGFNSPAAEKGLRAGEVIEEINQQTVETPADVTKVLTQLKKEGHKTGLFLVGNNVGDIHFVALPLN